MFATFTPDLACYIYTEHWQSQLVQYKGYFSCFEFHTVCKQRLQRDLIVILTVCKCSKSKPGLRVRGATMSPQVPKVCICAVRDVIKSSARLSWKTAPLCSAICNVCGSFLYRGRGTHFFTLRHDFSWPWSAPIFVNNLVRKLGCACASDSFLGKCSIFCYNTAMKRVHSSFIFEQHSFFT